MSSKVVYLCETHKKKFVGYCESCCINICLLCTSKHENHDLLQYNEIQPSNKKVEELKEKFFQYKKQNKILKEKMNLWLEKINYYTNKIQEILDNNEKIYESILSNYDTNNLIYAEIDNMNELRKKGLILGYKTINLELFSSDDKILEKSELIVKTIKEMQIEDLFFSLKEQKNMIKMPNITKNEENEKDKKENEDKKGKKVVKKKKSKISKKPNKEENNKENEKEKQTEKEAELDRKKYEDFKEINLKSKLFDDEYLINLGKSKNPNENLEKDLDIINSSLVKSINNRREINHVSFISFENIKYIVTTGYCYVNFFDLNGDLQRAFKIHDSDITYLIQMKNGDLLTGAIDGQMKIVRLGKNEGYMVIQSIDTTKVKAENKNNIFSNNQLYVLLQIKSNENIITSHGSNLLFYKQTNDNKDLYEFNYVVSYNSKKENDYDIICNNANISSLIEINNDNFVALNHKTIIFLEKDDKDKYNIKSEINNICGSGGPNNIVYFNNKIIIGGGDNIYIVDTLEKKIIKEININCCGINCLNINKKNDLLFIGFETKENKFEIKEYALINEENKIDIKEKRAIKNAHTSSISNIVPLEEEEVKEKENENMNVNVALVSGSHDKNLKYWA